MLGRKDKIIRVEIYTTDGKQLYSTEKNFDFPKNVDSSGKGAELIIIKGNNLPELESNTLISIVAQLKSGERIKYLTQVKISTPKQINAFITDENSQIMQDRRRFFKIKTQQPGFIVRLVRNNEDVKSHDVIKILIMDVNIGGVLISCDHELENADLVFIRADLFGERFEAQAEVLRIQRDENGHILGYGCRFINFNTSKEEIIARYIYKLQLEERRRKQDSYD